MGAHTLIGLRAAATFLTRLRVGSVNGADEIARGVPWFPVVGGLLGLAAAGVYAVARLAVPPFIAATVATAFSVWVTGAIHEDGLADTTDGFGGARSREETLRILKDPRLGAYGVMALVFALLIRVGALAAMDATAALVVLPTAHVLGRAGAVALLRGPIATEDGLGSSYASAVTRQQTTVAIVVGVLVGGVAMGPLVAAAVAGVALTSYGVGRMARGRLGGVTGDVLGAAEQTGEIVILLVGLAAARRGWLDVPWW